MGIIQLKFTLTRVGEFHNFPPWKYWLLVPLSSRENLWKECSLWTAYSPGPKGGISLKPQTLNKNIAEIVMKFEDFDLVECFNSESNTCNLNPGCKLKSIFEKANRQFVKELKKYKVHDIGQNL